MRAAVLHKPGEPLRFEDVPTPKPGPGEILIRVRACGVCHTDLHLAAGEWRLPKLPLILGHEAVGVVEAVGDGATQFRPGDRAGVPWIYSTCGTCEFCASDREALCPNVVVTGFMVDGGYAQYLKAPATHAVAVPKGLEFVSAAPLYCAGLTPYRALKAAGLALGQTVAVWGVGGLGHYAVQIAHAAGARVVAVDIAAEKLALARELGAEITVDASKPKALEAIRDLGGAHIVVNLAPNAATVRDAFSALRRGGTLVLVGLPPGDFSLPILGSVAKGIRILTSAVGTRQDLRELLSLAEAGKIRSVVETCRLEELNDVFERLQRSQVRGRIVLEFAE